MEYLKKNGGFTGIDIAMAILIITVFMSVISSLYINLYITNVDILRKEKAIGYATSILEKIDELYYSEVNSENFKVIKNSNGSESIAGINIDRGYNASINIVTYDPDNINIDVVKNIDLKITYEVGNKEKSIEFTKIKERENIFIPNIPDLKSEMVAVKYNSNDELIQTNFSDSSWYDYSDKRWAMAVMKNMVLSNGKVNDNADIYIWIPRFAYMGNNVEFIYGKGNKTVDKNGSLINISSDYVIPSEFSNDELGIWINIDELNSNNASKILNNSLYGPIKM